MSTHGVRRTLRARAFALGPAAAAAAAALLGSPAQAQFPDVLSETECPGCADHFAGHQRFAGTWSSALTSSDDPEWTLTDFYCVVACTPEERAAATARLTDPANAHRPVLELLLQRAPKFSCDPHGFASQVVSPLPLRIEQHPGQVVIHYEEFGAERAISLTGHAAPSADQPLSFGVSKGRFEDGAFVVETSHVTAGRFYDGFGGGMHSEGLRATERYTLSGDGDWLFLVLELVDPKTLGEPLILTKSWRRSPNAAILQYRCDVMSGQLEGVLADYLDPAALDARRCKCDPQQALAAR
jgi:hypothetical protein